jgi:uncharacterized membrane protein
MKLPGFPKSQRPVYNPRMNRTDRIPAMSLAEAAAALLGLTLLAAAQLIAARCTDLLSHPLWLDEVITARLVNDPSFTHMFKALASGVDTQPPVFYLLVWPIARVAGSLDNVALRAISLGSVLLGMVGAYAICRRYFGRTASAIAMLALWAHPMVIDQAFQARFYGPWLALTIWFCYLQLGADGETRAHRVARWIIAILAATMHYFGAISVGLIMLTDLLVHRRFKRIIPGIAALAAILLCAVLVFQQRRGLSVPTWIEPLSASQIKDVIYAMAGAAAAAADGAVAFDVAAAASAGHHRVFDHRAAVAGVAVSDASGGAAGAAGGGAGRTAREAPGGADHHRPCWAGGGEHEDEAACDPRLRR